MSAPAMQGQDGHQYALRSPASLSVVYMESLTHAIARLDPAQTPLGRDFGELRLQKREAVRRLSAKPGFNSRPERFGSV